MTSTTLLRLTPKHKFAYSQGARMNLASLGQEFSQDVLFAWRLLRKSPGFALVAVAILGVCIGANTAVFSVIDAVILQPLPYADSSRILFLSESNRAKGFHLFGVSSADYLDWAQRTTTFSHLAAYSTESVNLANADTPKRVRAARVTQDFFQVFQVNPKLGRTFLPAEEIVGNDNSVLLSARLWHSDFGSDPNILGRSILMNGRGYTVVGVMSEAQQFPDEIDIWKPLPLVNERRGARWLSVVGRVKASLSPEQAKGEMDAVQQNIGRENPRYQGWTADVLPLQDIVVGESRTVLLLLWGAVALVLLIACTNLAGLLIARAADRHREIAIRSALGATPGRILRQLLAEGAVLATLGGILGVALAITLLRMLLRFAPSLTAHPNVHIGSLGYGFAAALALFAALMFGLIPARESGRRTGGDALKSRTRSDHRNSARLRNGLVQAEIALAVVLLTGAGLLLRSVSTILATSPGFDARDVLSFRIAPPQVQPKAGDSEDTFITSYFAERNSMAGFYQRLMERISTMPGVESAGAVNRLPLTGNWWSESVVVENRPVAKGEEFNVKGRVVTPGYLETMHIRLLNGRTVQESDTASSMNVVLISRTMQRLLWPNEEAIGKRICDCPAEAPNPNWMTIVGVVDDVRNSDLKVNPEPTIYVPFAQARSGLFPDWGMDVVVRGRNPLALADTVRAVASQVDSSLPLFQIRSLEQIVAGTVEREHFLMVLFQAFAATALLLAVVGIYGLISYVVRTRMQEFGVRLALGAQPQDIIRMVVGKGLVLTVSGVAVGVCLSLLLARYLRALLFGVAPWDPMTLLSVCAVCVLGAIGASYLPARRATGVDPLVALRNE